MRVSKRMLVDIEVNRLVERLAEELHISRLAVWLAVNEEAQSVIDQAKGDIQSSLGLERTYDV